MPCAIYTRKSSEDGLEQGFNSLDAQREACEAFILSQKAQGWKAVDSNYDDGGFSGGNTERPGLKQLLADVALGRVRIIVVYKVDRLTRSLADFAKLVELFDAHGVSFVSVTQQFNTTSSMGRLTLNVLLSFAQFEREVTGERIRDKIAASKRKGMWMGGFVPIGYLPHERTLVIDEPQAERIRDIYRRYLEVGSVRRLKATLDQEGWFTPIRQTSREELRGGRRFSCGHLYRILSNPIYHGQIAHKDEVFDGLHPAIVETDLWQLVQDKLKANLQSHNTRSKATNPSLLTGLLFDDQGQRLTPTHTKKGARRYRYYVSQLLPKEGRDASPNGMRIPAQELENAVIDAITSFLQDEGRLISLIDQADANVVRNRLNVASSMADQLATSETRSKIEILHRFARKITIRPSKVAIDISVTALWEPTPTSQAEEDVTVIEVPVQLKRSGPAMKLIVKSAVSLAEKKADPKLTALIAKAHDWFERLSSGRSDSIQSIAKDDQVSTAYVTRVIYLAFLAPDIVQRIMLGDHPQELTAARLTRIVNLPNNWTAQREMLDMA